jgi:hypothetical protein
MKLPDFIEQLEDHSADVTDTIVSSPSSDKQDTKMFQPTPQTMQMSILVVHSVNKTQGTEQKKCESKLQSSCPKQHPQKSIQCYSL